MKKFKDILFSPWTLGIFALLVFALLVVLLGPLISIGSSTPLASTSAQLILIFAVAFLWITKRLVTMLLLQRKEKAMAEDMAGSEEDTNQQFSADEMNTLQERFKDAMNLLNQGGGKFKKKLNIYSLPWYIIIGPPGSGKTTALLNSGLKFPLSEKLGEQAIQGVGGTRNCDWWFTDQAVMIDTAGRYITQDSNKDIDGSGWLNFLSLLKKYRKRQPINGAFIAISASDLLVQSKQKRLEHVASIKQRIKELHQQLGIHFPIYVLITKTDLVAGFEEFFSNLDSQDREQVWGMTFALQGDEKNSPAANFNTEFDLLMQRLNQQILKRIHQERDVQRAAAIHSFPKQMQLFKELLNEFLSDIFDNTRYEQDAMLRGVYFTSGTQEGTPIDRLLNRLSQNTNMAVTRQAAAGEGKSYFITDVLKKVAFSEAGIAGNNAKLESKLAWLRRGSIAACLVSTIALLSTWTASYFYNVNYIDDVDNNLKQAQQSVSDLSVYDLDPLHTLDALNKVKSAADINLEGVELSAEQEQDIQEDQNILAPWYSDFGLQQLNKLQQQNLTAYHRVLNKTFLSRLMLMLEDQLSNPDTPLTFQYVALRTYLMLNSSEHYKADEVNAFFRESWLKRHDRTLTRDQRIQFGEHLDMLFAQRPSPLPMPLDQKLINQVQMNLQAISFDEQIYARIQQESFDQFPQFSIYDAAGRTAADLVFVRKSGKTLSDGIKPLYTKAVYQQLMAGEIANMAKDVLGEAWVYGDNHSRINNLDQDAIIKKVEMRYLNDYKNKYRELLADIDIMPFSSFDEASRVLSTLSGENSPLVLLIQGVKEQTSLVFENALVDAGKDSAIRAAQAKLSRMLGSNTDTNLGAIPGLKQDPVTREFAELNYMVKSKESAPLPIQPVLVDLGELYKFMSAISYESIGGAIPPALAQKGNSILQKLNFMLDTQPEIFLKPILTRIVVRSASLSQGGVVAHLNQMWHNEALGFCKSAISRRYPINKNAQSDIQLDDFSRFFGYGGMMDSFFKQHLKKYVDVSRSPWRVRSSQTAPIALSSSSLRAFEKADRIKRAFFKFGSDRAAFNFSLTPKYMDAGLSKFSLNIDGQPVEYTYGPLLKTELQWPGINPGSGARLEMRQSNGQSNILSESGPWALFKMLNKIQVRRTNSSERFDLSFTATGYKANFTLQAGASNNPFRLMTNMQFNCPNHL